MEKNPFVLGIFFLAVGLGGCASFFRSTHSAAPQALPAYAGPKASVAVADFQVKTGKATQKTGVGLRQLLIATLEDSRRFSIVAPQAEAREEENKPADLIISVSLVEFELQSSGGRNGVGSGGGAASGQFGGLLGQALNKARLILDIRILDAANTKSLGATQIKGEAVEPNHDFWGAHNFNADLAVYANTPMEKAIRNCIIESARYIWAVIPKSYYKH